MVEISKKMQEIYNNLCIKNTSMYDIAQLCKRKGACLQKTVLICNNCHEIYEDARVTKCSKCNGVDFSKLSLDCG
jgi:predicted Zn-ribbon and HTH transcriptional regulator